VLTLLEVQELSVSYGAIRAVRGLSMKVDAGQTVALVGANGAGKSSTMQTLAGLVRPSGGRILFGGKEITTVPAYRRSRSGLVLVPEGRQVLGSLTVEENLEMGGYNQSQSTVKEDLGRMYRRFPRLEERRKALAGTLSGGEQQMLAIGRALMAHPSLLLLDEPSMGLAPLVVAEIFRIISEIQKDGVTVLLVEQQITQALQIASYAYVLERGELALEGKPDALLSRGQMLEAYLGGRTAQPAEEGGLA
jgi:branched-chain amino acid transport system ATP-binding protein